MDTNSKSDNRCVHGIEITDKMINAAARHLSNDWGICSFTEAEEIVEAIFRTMISCSDQLRDERSKSAGGNSESI
jgi:hypothetical protein